MSSPASIKKHPVHPMLVAYPIAFYTSTLVGFTIYAATDEPFWLPRSQAEMNETPGPG